MPEDTWAGSYTTWRQLYGDDEARVARAVVSEKIAKAVEVYGTFGARDLKFT